MDARRVDSSVDLRNGAGPRKSRAALADSGTRGRGQAARAAAWAARIPSYAKASEGL